MIEEKDILNQILTNQNKIEKQLDHLNKKITLIEHLIFPFNHPNLKECDSPNPTAFKTIHRNITLTAEPILNFANGKRGHELLSVYDDKFASIKFGIIDTKNNGISFKIKFGAELEDFIAKSKYALEQSLKQKNTQKSTDDYSDAYVTFKMGNLKGESPASLLFANRAAELMNQRNYMKEHLHQYPKNADWIKRIDQTIKWFKDGKLKNTASNKIEIYNRQLRVNPYKKKGEKYYTSAQKITFEIGEQYPCHIQAFEAYGDAVKKGNLLVSNKNFIDKKSVSISLSEVELRDLIERITLINELISKLRMLQTLYPTFLLSEKLSKKSK